MNRKYIIAVLVGVLSAAILVFILELFSHSLYPVDVEEFTKAVNSKDRELFRAFALKQPLGSFISIVLAHGFGLLGGLVGLGRFKLQNAKKRDSSNFFGNLDFNESNSISNIVNNRSSQT